MTFVGRVADYEAVSESPGDEVLPAAVEMAQVRYAFAAAHVAGARILEVACGSGHGLGALSGKGRVIGMDLTHSPLQRAKAHYRGRVMLVRADAQQVPLATESIDSVVVFEAIYYLPDISAFFRECARVLGPRGSLVICWANPAHYEFVRGAFTFSYPSGQRMRELLAEQGFSSTLYAAFPTRQGGFYQKVRSVLKRVSGRLGMVPAGMRGKALLKRLFYGALVPFPNEITAPTDSIPLPVEAPEDPDTYRVLYAVAVKSLTPTFPEAE